MGILKFFREASAELEHVAWPTPSETKRYFAATVGLMAAAGLLIFVAVSSFSAGLFWAKEQVNPAIPTFADGKLPELPQFDLSGATVSSEATPAATK